jgi:hypothetical protein
MDEVKSLMIVPQQRTVLPARFQFNRPARPLNEKDYFNLLFLPGGNVMQQFYSGQPLRCGFRLPQQYPAMLSGSWLVVGYDQGRNEYRDVGFTPESLTNMITWEPKFAALMATSQWKRLDTHRPSVNSGNERIRELDGATLRAMESLSLVDSYSDGGARRWNITDKGFGWLQTLHALLDNNLIVAADRPQLKVR